MCVGGIEFSRRVHLLFVVVVVVVFLGGGERGLAGYRNRD